MWAGQFTNTAGLMMLVPIMPFYVRDMGVRGTAEIQAWAGVAIAAPALVLTVATPLWGRLGDRVGRHWMVVRALAGLAASMLVMAVATNPLTLVAGRLLQGGLGGVVEAAQAFAGAAAPGGRRGSALGKSFSATAAGSLAGPVLGGALVGAGQLAVLMVVIAVVAALLAGACALGLRDPRTAPPEPTARPGPAARQDRSRRAGFWRVPGALPLAAAAVAAYLGVYGLIPVFAEHVQQGFPSGRAGLWVGIFQSLTWGATLVASFWWGRHNDRAQRPVRTLAVATTVCAASITAQALPLGVAGLVVLRAAQGIGFAALAQSLFFHFGGHALEEQRSGYVGTANSFLLVGQSAGPLLAGPLALVLPTPASIVLLGAACGVAGACCACAARSERARGSAAERSADRGTDAPVLRRMSGNLDPPSEESGAGPAPRSAAERLSQHSGTGGQRPSR
nr:MULTISPECIES: MFS transporter [unclassified Actinopolyspora]